MVLKWKIAVMLAVAAALNYADRAAISSVLAPLRDDLGLTDVALGSVGGVSCSLSNAFFRCSSGFFCSSALAIARG